MLITNLTGVDYWFGPMHLAASGTLTLDDTTDTSLYLLDDDVADSINTAVFSGLISVTNTNPNSPFPRPTGTPSVLHGNGSPNGVVYAPPGSLYLRRDVTTAAGALYAKTTGIDYNTGWLNPANPISRVTTLPTATAVDLEQVIYDPGIANTEWLCTFNLTSGYWTVAGPPLLIDPNNTTGSGPTSAWQELNYIAVPNAGDYLVKLVGGEFANNGSSPNFSVDVTAGAASGSASAPNIGLGSLSSWPIPGIERILTGMTANEHASLMGNANNGTGWVQVSGEVYPLRIK